jgi:hypothetical protein
VLWFDYKTVQFLHCVLKLSDTPSLDIIDLIDSDCLVGQVVTLFDGDQEQATIVMVNAEDGERVGGCVEV